MKRFGLFFILALLIPGISHAEKVRWEGVLFFKQTEKVLPNVEISTASKEKAWHRKGLAFYYLEFSETEKSSNIAKTDENGRFTLKFDPDSRFQIFRITFPGKFQLHTDLHSLVSPTATESSLPDTLVIDLNDFLPFSTRPRQPLQWRKRPVFKEIYVFREPDSTGWSGLSFPKEAAMNQVIEFLEAFPEASLFPIQSAITISPDNWKAMLDSLHPRLIEKGANPAQIRFLKEPVVNTVPSGNNGNNTRYVGYFLAFVLIFEEDEYFNLSDN